MRVTASARDQPGHVKVSDKKQLISIWEKRIV